MKRQCNNHHAVKQNSSISVLFVVWELEPFIKVGGLGEVARSLARALYRNGVDIRVALPNYKAVRFYRKRKQYITTFSLRYGKKLYPVTINQIKFLNADIPVYLFGSSPMLDRPTQGTFAFFDAAVVTAVQLGLLEGWKPKIIHCNDNHSGLVPLLVKMKKIPVKTLLTIHCITHQRKLPLTIADYIGIPRNMLNPHYWETKNKQLNSLLEGIIHADLVNTVSPTYLKEIQTEYGGAGLDDVVVRYKKKTIAILNGIDYELKNPSTNPSLCARYTILDENRKRDVYVIDPKEGKRKNKLYLQSTLGFRVDESATLIGFIGRFDVRQKGIDLIHRMLVRNNIQRCQFVIMGQGETAWEERFRNIGVFYPENIRIITQFNDVLATQIYAAADFIMIPSHFEPCCLVQMNAMHYGALPIARATGGLNDTVFDGKNGFLFEHSTSLQLEQVIKRAIHIKKYHVKQFDEMVRNAMRTDFSWTESAKKYITLYRDMLKSS